LSRKNLCHLVLLLFPFGSLIFLRFFLSLGGFLSPRDYFHRRVWDQLLALLDGLIDCFAETPFYDIYSKRFRQIIYSGIGGLFQHLIFWHLSQFKQIIKGKRLIKKKTRGAAFFK